MEFINIQFLMRFSVIKFSHFNLRLFNLKIFISLNRHVGFYFFQFSKPPKGRRVLDCGFSSPLIDKNLMCIFEARERFTSPSFSGPTAVEWNSASFIIKKVLFFASKSTYRVHPDGGCGVGGIYAGAVCDPCSAIGWCSERKSIGNSTAMWKQTVFDLNSPMARTECRGNKWKLFLVKNSINLF